jgi:large subunit ribosomal protein L18
VGWNGNHERERRKEMIEQHLRNAKRKRVHVRLRKTLTGTTERPRLNIYRSLNHIYAQVIDDAVGKTLVAANSSEKSFSMKTGGSVAAAKIIGTEIAKRAREKGIEKVAFDRGGYLYHGRVKALADAAREAGLKF